MSHIQKIGDALSYSVGDGTHLQIPEYVTLLYIQYFCLKNERLHDFRKTNFTVTRKQEYFVPFYKVRRENIYKKIKTIIKFSCQRWTSRGAPPFENTAFC